MALAPLSVRARSRVVAFPAAAVLAFALGCDNDMGGRACTASFDIITVSAREPGGAALESATATSTLLRTGEELEVTTLALLEPGTYAVVDDGSLQRIRAAGDVVRFEAQAGALLASADFSVSSSGGCHVSKLAGPDTVWAAYLPD
jgi:hypothetical protein